MPAAPRVGNDFMDYLGYWTALQSFLSYSFGWTRPDRGLRWWYEAGKPGDDPRLALVSEVWERDGNLMAFTEWCHDRLEHFAQQALNEWTAYDGARDQLSPEWERTLRAARREQEDVETSPHGKHLENGDHAAGPAAEGYAGSITVVDRPKRRAIYACESALGWYRGLAELGAQLPPLGEPSWNVDVYVRSTGFMGTYRRSRDIGLWFAGQHRYHIVGN